ncbi:MAG TPA: DEAD/DEAH box helicase [Thermoanaerobaculia bacterium]|nr:DEAD/DEAH box helicase [Thermoanaerobaculia bacterium]
MAHLDRFHPAVGKWFAARLGEPTPPQVEGWPLIREGKNTLIAAPTGSGKTLAAFLSAIDSLIRQGSDLKEETQVLYVSPLRALSNDVQKNLQGPLAEIAEMDPSVPEVRVLVRTGDTPSSERTAMAKRPPHILVTTPESLYLLLTSDGGRGMLRTVSTVIVDEIHALVRDKRGSHLAISLERLEELAGRPVQRVGLSATQKPLSDVARFLVGTDRDCALVDAGTFRELDLGIEIPPSPLSTVCSHEQWQEIYARIGELIREHRTTLVFVNTRKMAERIAGQLTRLLGEEAVTSHHGSLSKARRLDAEERLKAGKLRALVATASLELGIDIGDVNLVIQVGATRSIATFLQRVGRAGHALKRIPKGRLFPLTLDELVEGAALLRCIRGGVLDRTPMPPRPLDILAQQIVASCVPEAWREEKLLDVVRRAWPYRDLSRSDFDRVVALHTEGRRALLHRDGVNGRLMATKRARLTALLSGGAIPDAADYQVRLEPEGTLVGTVNEDWAVESNSGDIFQLGNASWRVIRIEPGIVRVADAKGQPPSLPFWLGEAPGRTRELAAEIGGLRQDCADRPEVSADLLRVSCGEALPAAGAVQVAEFIEAGRRVLGTVPTQKRVILERFFDESGGMQLIVHAPFGSRINKAWGLALRKKFCVGFGFELQAAANEEAIVLSLGPQHSFELEDVFNYLHPDRARDVLVQALLAAPLFETRWRWNAQRSLLLERSRGGKKIPAPLQRMRANDMLAAAFPQVLACPETLPGGPIEVPMDHPVVAQTIEDCLTEAMDLDGFLEVLRGLRDGSIEKRAVDTAEPSSFARGILSSQPYTFLDDAPLEERRTQAVLSRRVLDSRSADEIGALDPEAIARVKEEAWPDPSNAEEVHEALLWMGYVADEEAEPWRAWLEELAAAGRVTHEDAGWFAVEATRDPKAVLKGRMEALGPIVSDDPLLVQLEGEGVVLRTRIAGQLAWCDRRLLARIQRYTLERLRREIEPVSAAQFLRFLAAWQHVDPEHRLEGPRGVAQVVSQLAGFEVPAAAWEGSILPARVRGYRRDWLDQLTLSGEVAWSRLWGGAVAAVRRAPVCLVERKDMEEWAVLAGQMPAEEPKGTALQVFETLQARGAMFFQELARATKLPPSFLEAGLSELIALGRVTCDSFAGLRWLIVPASRRREGGVTAGRWSLAPRDGAAPLSPEFVARKVLARTGVVFRKTLAREKLPVPWRDIARVCRTLEARGEVRGGRFVAGFDGEQYALPEAIPLLRAVRRKSDAGEIAPLSVSAADPLNFQGILTPDERISPATRQQVRVA